MPVIVENQSYLNIAHSHQYHLLLEYFPRASPVVHSSCLKLSTGNVIVYWEDGGKAYTLYCSAAVYVRVCNKTFEVGQTIGLQL